MLVDDERLLRSGTICLPNQDRPAGGVRRSKRLSDRSEQPEAGEAKISQKGNTKVIRGRVEELKRVFGRRKEGGKRGRRTKTIKRGLQGWNFGRVTCQDSA